MTPMQEIQLEKNLSFNRLKPSGYFMYHRVQHSEILLLEHKVYFCALYAFRNKVIISYTAPTDCFL